MKVTLRRTDLFNVERDVRSIRTDWMEAGWDLTYLCSYLLLYFYLFLCVRAIALIILHVAILTGLKESRKKPKLV